MATAPPPPLAPQQPSSSSTVYEILPATALKQTISLQQPSKKKGQKKPSKLLRRFRSAFLSFPIITPICKFPVHVDNHLHGGTHVTGTLFGHRRSRVNLVIQENPRSLPFLLLELGIFTGKLLQELGKGLVRITLECEKHPVEKIKIAEEPIWTLYHNGRKNGYGVRREASEEDLKLMQMLHATSMGAGLLPSDVTDYPDGELMYMRAKFERVVGSKDSETYYMSNIDGSSGPELSIFFVRI